MGEYEFQTTSDDGSRLYIDDKKVVENWGLHGMVNKKGTVVLSKGYHDFKVEYFNHWGGAGCIVKYKGPDTAG